MEARYTNTTPPHRKWYALSVEQTLFGPAVVRRWGRIGAVGREKIDFYTTRGEALQEYTRHCERRIKRGYLVEPIAPRPPTR